MNDQADIRQAEEDFIEEQQPDRFPAQLSRVAFIAGTGFFTFVLFPALVYYSIVVYGLFASAFMTAGFLIWRELLRNNPRKAMGFGFGFLPPVLIILALYSTAAPWFVLAIIGEFLVFSFTLHLWLRDRVY